MTEASFPRGEQFADDLQHDSWDQERGMPTLMHAANALQVWAVFQSRERVTVREAAVAFNLDDAQVRELVDAHPWMFLEGPGDDPTKQFIRARRRVTQPRDPPGGNGTMGTMNLLSRIFTRSAPVLADVPLRASTGQFTPSPRTRERMSRKASVETQLGCYVARTTLAERAVETELFFAVSRSLATKAGRGR